DGTRTIEEIAEEFDAALTKAGDSVMEKGEPITDPVRRKEAISKLTDNILNSLLRGCALVG
ncbi:MAG TPA: hypothetical protein PLO23_10290, partial [Alphaproteobacteria bacterium]|nr:hypothetical protein [Alphaproteobacteria bacterium]